MEEKDLTAYEEAKIKLLPIIDEIVDVTRDLSEEDEKKATLHALETIFFLGIEALCIFCASNRKTVSFETQMGAIETAMRIAYSNAKQNFKEVKND